MQIIYTAPASFNQQAAQELNELNLEIKKLGEQGATVRHTREKLDLESKIDDVRASTLGLPVESCLMELCRQAAHEALIDIVKDELTKMIDGLDSKAVLLCASRDALVQKLKDEFKAGFATHFFDSFSQRSIHDRDPASWLHYSLVMGGLNVLVRLDGNTDVVGQDAAISLDFGPVETKR